MHLLSYFLTLLFLLDNFGFLFGTLVVQGRSQEKQVFGFINPFLSLNSWACFSVHQHDHGTMKKWVKSTWAYVTNKIIFREQKLHKRRVTCTKSFLRGCSSSSSNSNGGSGSISMAIGHVSAEAPMVSPPNAAAAAGGEKRTRKSLSTLLLLWR